MSQESKSNVLYCFYCDSDQPEANFSLPQVSSQMKCKRCSKARVNLKGSAETEDGTSHIMYIGEERINE